MIKGYTTFEWEGVCREVMNLKVHRRGAAEVVALSAHAVGEHRVPPAGASGKFATVLATGDSQLPVAAMKSTLALPGLEADSTSADEGRLGEVAPAGTQDSVSYGESTIGLNAVHTGLAALNCSNVANALRDLLELATRAGIDPTDPVMKAAARELEELVTSITRQSSAEERGVQDTLARDQGRD